MLLKRALEALLHALLMHTNQRHSCVAQQQETAMLQRHALATP